MNKELMKQAGFTKEVEKVERGECPFCGSTKVKREDFRDEKSWREFNISGLCQEDQDRIFGAEDNDEDEFWEDEDERDYEADQ